MKAFIFVALAQIDQQENQNYPLYEKKYPEGTAPWAPRISLGGAVPQIPRIYSEHFPPDPPNFSSVVMAMIGAVAMVTTAPAPHPLAFFKTVGLGEKEERVTN